MIQALWQWISQACYDSLHWMLGLDVKVWQFTSAFLGIIVGSYGTIRITRSICRQLMGKPDEPVLTPRDREALAEAVVSAILSREHPAPPQLAAVDHEASLASMANEIEALKRALDSLREGIDKGVPLMGEALRKLQIGGDRRGKDTFFRARQAAFRERIIG